MPDIDFRYFCLVQTLDDGLLVAEPLFFPDISTVGRGRAGLMSAVKARVRESLEGLAAGEVYRRRAAGVPAARTIDVEVRPRRGSVGWREPVTLTFDYAQWEHGGEAHIAYVPTLGIEAMAPTERGLETKLRRDVRAALGRLGAAGSLEGLNRLQGRRGLEVVESRVRVKIRSPLEERAGTGGEEPKSVLEEVATDLVRAGRAPAFGVAEPVARLAEALSSDPPSSVLVVGASGAGKTAVVGELVRARRGHGLERTPFWSTSGARLVAGATGFGMWQERCQKVVDEAAKARAVLHVESLVELIGVGRGVGGGQGVAGFFRPYVERGDLQVIAECAPEQLAVVEREEPQLLAALRRVEMTPPDRGACRAILRGFVDAGGRGGSITDGAIDAVERLHRRFAGYSALPGRPLRFLKDLMADRGGEAVTERDVVAAFAGETGMPRFLLDGDEPLRLDETRGFFERRVMGQPHAVDLVVDVLATVKAGLSPAGRPVASMLFVGPTGVGKTEMAKGLAEFMYRSRTRMIRIDMSEYADMPAIDRLIGGSLASEGLLTAKVREQPFSVVLLDEFEKAHPSFFDLLLQVLGEGRLTDGAGRVADFSNAIVLMTSNLGVDSFGRGSPGFRAADERLPRPEPHFVARVREFVRPEFFNRVDRIVPFSPLDRAAIRAIARRELDKVRSRDGIRHRRLALDVDDAVVDFLADRGYEPRYGARPLQRAIDQGLTTRLAACVNRYDADLPIEVRADLVDGAVAASARAQPGEAADALSRQPMALAVDVTSARREVRLLEFSWLMQDVRDELHRLDRQARRTTGAYRAWGTTREHEERLRRLVRDMDALGGRAVRLEDETLSAFYADVPIDDAAVRASLASLREERERLEVDVLVEWEDPPERITLVLSGEDERQIAALAAAYIDVVRRRNGQTALSELHRHPPPPGAVKLSAFQKRPADEGCAVYARRIRRTAPFLGSPPGKLLGAAVSVTGRPFHLLFRGEHGLHVFRGKHSRDQACRIDVVDGNDVDYRPPPLFGRRGAEKGLETRRVYDFSDGTVYEPGGKKTLRTRMGPDDDIADALSAAVERRLSDRIAALLEEAPGE